MKSLETASFDIEQFESISRRDSLIHRMDPRAKILVTFIYLACLLSLSPHDLFGISVFLAYPAVMLILADLPAALLVKRSLIALPFVLFIGILNPVFDKAPFFQLGEWSISGGWISFLVIIIRGVLSVLAALILLSTTGIDGISKGLRRLGIPSVITTQLIFVFRYLFILIGEASTMLTAARLRNYSNKPLSLSTWRNMTGSLLLRSLHRAERVYQSLLCRGFDGELKTMKHQYFGKKEWCYLAVWGCFFLLVRLANPVQFIGSTLHSLFSL